MSAPLIARCAQCGSHFDKKFDDEALCCECTKWARLFAEAVELGVLPKREERKNS